MKEFQRKTKSSSRIGYKIIIIFLILLLFVVSRAVWGGYKKNTISRTSLEKTNQELLELEKQKSDLTSQVEWLASPRGQEEEIRKNFSVAKPGEKVFIVIDQAGEVVSTEAEEESETWWQAITRYLRF